MYCAAASSACVRFSTVNASGVQFNALFSRLLFISVFSLFLPLVIALVCFSIELNFLPLVYFDLLPCSETSYNHLTLGDVNPDFATSAQTLLDHCAGLSLRLLPSNQVGAEPTCQTSFIFMNLCCAVSRWEYSRLGSVSNQMPHTFTAPAARIRIIQDINQDYAYIYIFATQRSSSIRTAGWCWSFMFVQWLKSSLISWLSPGLALRLQQRLTWTLFWRK